MKATKFGIYLRKLRLDHQMLLKDMASKLGISPAYLSAIELGKRQIPDELVDNISSSFEIKDNKLTELYAAVANSQTSVNVSLEGMDSDNKEVFLAFARKLKTLDSNQLIRINELLKD